MDMSKVFLITDLDGTLLPDNKVLSEGDIKAIKCFVSDGGRFSIATGRTIQASRRYINALDVNMPVILYNGSLIYDVKKDSVIYTEVLPDCARKISEEIMTDNPECGAEILRFDDVYVVRNNEYEIQHMDICKIVPQYTDIEKAPQDNWFKVLFADSPEKITKLCEDVKKYIEVDFVRSADIFIEMLPKGSSKGKALGVYSQKLKMQGFTIIAAGDYNNDIEMLEAADYGCATANAQQEVKDISNIVLKRTSNENAIAELIDMIYSGEIELKG